MDARQWGRWWRIEGKPALLDRLRRDWDPIGFGELLPKDEYECVTGPLGSLLQSGAKVEPIAATLAECRTGHLGLEPDARTDRRVAEEILAWYTETISIAASGDIPGR